MNIKIKNLTHAYDVNVLDDLHLDLDGYHAIGIIGISGSGKSTLLRILAGIEKPNQGTVEINGQFADDKHYKQNIGFVFQSHTLFPHLTLLENITIVLEKTRGIDKQTAKKTAIENLTRLGLDDQKDKRPNKVSGGQAQRASIARALSVNPDILFLDEPTSSLDPILTDEVLSSVEKLKGLGKDFIFVTHVISFVKDFADYVLYMDQGVIAEQGTPDMLDNPKTDALKNFMNKVR